MEVSSVELKILDNPGGRVLAFASVVFDEQFVVHNVRLVRAKSGLVVAMPNEEYKGRLRDIAHPLNSQFREEIMGAIVEQFNREVGPNRQIASW